MSTKWLWHAGPLALVTLVFLAAGTVAGKGGGKPKPPPDPQPPPATHAIIYVNGTYEGPLFVMDLDGANSALVLDDPRAAEPCYAPDGDRVAFQTTTGGAGVWVLDLYGGNLFRAATSFDGFASGTSWSFVAPPGSVTEMIAFTQGDANYVHDIWVVAPDGSGLANLTQTPGTDEFEPCWNRAGDRIVATVVGTGTEQGVTSIVVFEIGEGPCIAGATDLTASGPLAEASVGGPKFARTSDHIVVEALLPGEGRSDVWIIDPAQPAAPVRVTSTADMNEQMPCWNADDTKIILRAPAGKRGTMCLFSINPDGSGLTQLGSGKTVQSCPDCRP